MGWGDTAYNWLKRGTSFVANTAWNVLESINTVPSVAWEYVANPKARQISLSLLHIIAEDLLPFVLLNQTLSSFQQYIDDTSEENPHAWLSYFTLQAVSTLMQSSFFLYKFRQKQRLAARTGVLTIQNNNLDIRKTDKFEICDDCPGMSYVTGSVRDLGVFYLTELGIVLISYIPVVGNAASTIFSIYHKGRYALAAATPEMCPRHRQKYVNDNPSLALSLGLFQHGSVWTASQLTSWMSNMPANEVAKMIDLLFMLPTVSVAAKRDLPAPNDNDTNLLLDPLAAYENVMAWWITVGLKGLKSELPKLLKGPKAVIDWASMQQYYESLSKHPATKFAKYLFISDIFHSIPRLKQDPVIKQFWTQLCTSLADIAEGIVDWGKSPSINLLAYNKKTTDMSAKVVNWYKGYPKSLVKIAATAITNKAVQDWLLDFARLLRKEQALLASDSSNFFIQQAQTLGLLIERCMQVNHSDANQAALILFEGMLSSAKPMRNLLITPPKNRPANPFIPPSSLTDKPLALSQRPHLRPVPEKGDEVEHEPPKPSELSSLVSGKKPDEFEEPLRLKFE
ncbi:hypothetical protein [Legionella sp. W05-934-2]|uniref:hypothetical protein n=1 Tax=Legionella sp. W05-934-2 TaxID=1198649 RepID=UPI0034635B3F